MLSFDDAGSSSRLKSVSDGKRARFEECMGPLSENLPGLGERPRSLSLRLTDDMVAGIADESRTIWQFSS